MAGDPRAAFGLVCALALGCHGETASPSSRTDAPAPATPAAIVVARPAAPASPVVTVVARLTHVEGDVRIQRASDASWLPATEGTNLGPQDTVQVLVGAAELRVLESGATLHVDRATTVRMPRPDARAVQPLAGRMTARVQAGAGAIDELQVELPPGTLVLRADGKHLPAVEAAVELDAHASSIEMRAGGAALTSRSGVEIPLPARRWATFRADGSLVESGASGSIAQLQSPSAGAELQTTGQIDLVWTAVPGADRYTVSLASGTTTRTLDAAEPTLHTRIATGAYRWAVRGWSGADPWPYSPAREFRVVVDDRPPPLVIESPGDQAAVTGPTVRFVGHSEPGATVEIKGAKSVVDKSGAFAIDVAVEHGLTNFVVKARDPLGNERRVARSVLWD